MAARSMKDWCHPCIINGKDYGQLLYTLGVMGWLMLATLPGGAFAFMIWLIVLVLHRQGGRRETLQFSFPKAES